MSCSSKPVWGSTFVSWLALGLLTLAPATPSFAQEGGEAPPKVTAPAEPSKEPPKEGEGAEAAKGDTSAASPETAADATEEGGAAELSGANEALFLEDYPRAARLAYQSMVKTKPSSEKYESGQFALAQALENLGLRQAAAEYYFAVAQQRQNPALLSRALAGLERLARDGALDEDKLLRGVLVEAELSNIPPKVADFLHFYRGLSNLRAGYRRWAGKDFAQVRSDSYYGRKVQLVQAVTAVRDGRAEEAMTAVDGFLSDLEARTKKEAEERGVIAEERKEIVPGAPEPVRVARGTEAEARLIRARLLYDLGRYVDAVSEYTHVVRTQESPAGELLLERAWAHFRSGDFHDAMGLLYSLGAPSTRQLFLPDQYVLRGLIYQRFCHFRAAKAAVADYRSRYAATVKQLKDGAAPREIEPIAVAARELVEVAPAVRIQREVQSERERLEAISGQLEEGGAAAHLAALYQLLDDRALWVFDRAMEAGARTVAERLLEADEQANLLDYEVGVSIFRPIKDFGGTLRARKEVEEVPNSGIRVYYPFDEEFWSDELPNMRFLIQDRCVE